MIGPRLCAGRDAGVGCVAALASPSSTYPDEPFVVGVCPVATSVEPSTAAAEDASISRRVMR